MSSHVVLLHSLLLPFCFSVSENLPKCALCVASEVGGGVVVFLLYVLIFFLKKKLKKQNTLQPV